ncbi:MAG: PHP domain-containing protein [Firmicutes bacterium]|nr:PHP domain-containing protein [Bacillota bacterium]
MLGRTGASRGGPGTGGEAGLRVYTADLHVHTALSPCAEPEMTPVDIVRVSIERGLDIVAVTDHNSGRNVRAVAACAEGEGVTVWPGMEVQTREEVHLVVLTDGLAELEEWERFIRAHLPSRPNRPEVFGEQLLFDEQGRVCGVEEQILLTSVDLGVDQVLREARRRGHVCYPAHIDRPAFSYVSNLGLAPPAEDFEVVELSRRARPEEVKARYPSLGGRTLIVASDAHRLAELGLARSLLVLREPSLVEFRAAIAGRDGRKVVSGF